MRKILILLLLLGVSFVVTSAVKPEKAEATTGWSWIFFTYNGNVWMRSYYNDVGKFDFCLGGGGCISQMRYCPASYRHVLASTSEGEHVDRVVQWVFWGLEEDPAQAADTLAEAQAEQMYDYHAQLVINGNYNRCRFNMNQAGSCGRLYPADDFTADIFAPTMEVDLDTANDVVEIYSVQQDNWWQVHNGNQSAKIPAYTCYESMPYGVLKIRRVMVIPEPVSPNYDPETDETYTLQVAGWTPFKWDANTFNAVTTKLTSPNGVPSTSAGEGYILNPTIGDEYRLATGMGVTESEGYTVVFQSGYTNMPHVALVFGKNNASVISSPYGAGGGRSYSVSLMDWIHDGGADKGVCMIPRLTIKQCKPGTVIDQTLFLVAYPNTSPALYGLLNSLVTNYSSTLQPKIYGPTADLPGDLEDIVEDIEAYRNTAATQQMRTENLADLLP